MNAIIDRLNFFSLFASVVLFFDTDTHLLNTPIDSRKIISTYKYGIDNTHTYNASGFNV